MSTLESLLRPVTAMINRQIQAKTPARELSRQLGNRVMALRVKDTALSLYVAVAGDSVTLANEYGEEPDVVITGSLLSLVKLVGPAGEDAIRQGDIDLSGDALVAQQFQRLLALGRPDIEEELSSVIGDAAAHGVGEVFRGVQKWGRATGETMRQNVGEYLQEESRAVPTRDEIDGFRRHVNALRDDVARAEARLQKIESRDQH